MTNSDMLAFDWLERRTGCLKAHVSYVRPETEEAVAAGQCADNSKLSQRPLVRLSSMCKSVFQMTYTWENWKGGQSLFYQGSKALEESAWGDQAGETFKHLDLKTHFIILVELLCVWL